MSKCYKYIEPVKFKYIKPLRPYQKGPFWEASVDKDGEDHYHIWINSDKTQILVSRISRRDFNHQGTRYLKYGVNEVMHVEFADYNFVDEYPTLESEIVNIIFVYDKWLKINNL